MSDPTPQEPTMTRRDRMIVAAAIYVGDLTISMPRPARHHHLLHKLADYGIDDQYPRLQGFLTNTGRFVDRELALHIAEEAGQIIRRSAGENSTYLFSEDMW